MPRVADREHIMALAEAPVVMAGTSGAAEGGKCVGATKGPAAGSGSRPGAPLLLAVGRGYRNAGGCGTSPRAASDLHPPSINR